MNEGSIVALGERAGDEMVTEVFHNIDEVHEWPIPLKVTMLMEGPLPHSACTEDSVKGICDKQSGVKQLWVSILNKYVSVLES